MPFGGHKTGEGWRGAFDLVGRERWDERKSVAEYREWPFWRFMFSMRPSVTALVWPWTLSHAVIAVGVVCIDQMVSQRIRVDSALLKLLTVPTAFLLLFRVNVAYKRFWEGRGHFETFNYALREISRRTFTFIRGPGGVMDPQAARIRQHIMRLLMLMAIACRENLRERSLGVDAIAQNLAAARKHLTPEEYEVYTAAGESTPLLVMSWVGKWVHKAYLDGFLPQRQMLMSFDSNVSQLLEGWMGMAKVCYQPVPFPYIQTLHYFLLAWLIVAHCTLVAKYEPWLFVLIMIIAATAIYSLEELAAEVEDPFGDDINDLSTENFEIGLERDGRLCLSGMGSQDFSHLHEATDFFSPPEGPEPGKPMVEVVDVPYREAPGVESRARGPAGTEQVELNDLRYI